MCDANVTHFLCTVAGRSCQVALWISHLPLLQPLLAAEEARWQIINNDFNALLLQTFLCDVAGNNFT